LYSAASRVQENLRSCECSVCAFTPEDEEQAEFIKEFILTDCCNVLVGNCCAVKAFNLQPNGNKLVGKCSKCKQLIDVDNLIIISVVEKDLIGKLVDMSKADISKVIDDTPVVTLDEVERILHKNPKIKVLLSIIRGCKDGNKFLEDGIVSVGDGDDKYKVTTYTEPIDNLIVGVGEVNPATTGGVIVCCSTDEGIKNIIKVLTVKGVKYAVIEGTAATIANNVKQFNEGTIDVVIIHSYMQCAGVNLQSARALVMYNNIGNKQVTTQVIGRGHRIGRRVGESLVIYTLAHEDNEIYFK
jgi:hypothetical protein